MRSYVLRQGRITRAQQRALEEHWKEYGVEFQKSRLDLNQVFGRSAPRVLDIGSGYGDTTVTLALAHPENDYLTVEVHKPGVGSLLRKIVEQELPNIRIISHDVVDVLECQIPPRSFDEIYIFFPDPWPKKRHHKRRLVSPVFLELLASRLKSHGRLFLATDWKNLAQHMLEAADACAELFNLAGKGRFAPRPRWRPPTRFEQRGARLNFRVWDLIYATSRPSNALKEASEENSPVSRGGA